MGWIDRLGKNPEAHRHVCQVLRRATQSRTRDVTLAREPMADVLVTGQRFADACEWIADHPPLYQFFEDWGYSSAADRLVAASAILYELGYSDEPADVAANDPYTPGENGDTPEWAPNSTPRPFRLPNGAREITPTSGLPGTPGTPYAPGPTEVFPGSSRWRNR